jgi:hypothetical protein
VRVTLFVIPVLIVMMLTYMFWSVGFRLRRDRLREARSEDRSALIFSRRHRIRYLLSRAFDPAPEEPDWQPELVSRLHENNRPPDKA